MTGAAPSAVVTFLFTDVEGSTRRWEVDAEGMRAALAAHGEVLRDAIRAHAGFLFEHTGDGVCAAFSSPRSAADAAVAAQLRLELPVRMGLAIGEADHRHGDYFGAVVNRAARVMAAGHGGQVLLADSTAVLLSAAQNRRSRCRACGQIRPLRAAGARFDMDVVVALFPVVLAIWMLRRAS
jgi:class 3 adenylate cyclase